LPSANGKACKESCVPLEAELSDKAQKYAGSALIDTNENDWADGSRSYDVKWSSNPVQPNSFFS
jgi:hypothetical protein